MVKHDLAKEPPSRELLERLIDKAHLELFLNRRSPAYKARNLGARKLTKKQVIDLMMEDPNLIRRPIVQIRRSASRVVSQQAQPRLQSPQPRRAQTHEEAGHRSDDGRPEPHPPPHRSDQTKRISSCFSTGAAPPTKPATSARANSRRSRSSI